MSSPQPRADNTPLFVVGVFVVLVCYGLLKQCAKSTDGDRYPSSAPSRVEHTPEYTLAALDDAASCMDREAKLERRIGNLLDQLATTYVESRSHIADMTYAAQQSLRRDGIEVRCVPILEAVNLSTLPSTGLKRYAEVVALYMLQRQQGFGHEEAAHRLR